MTFWQHSKAVLGVLFISANLISVLIPLLLLLLMSPLGRCWPSLDAHLHNGTFFLYRYAVWVNDCWFQKVVGVTWRVHEPAENTQGRMLRDDRSYLVIANHQSWFDIYVLQSLIVRHGPMLKFLVKRNLIFVPIVGWIILALRFPLLKRRSAADSQRESQGKNQRKSTHDINAIEKACNEVCRYPTALLNFVEGTRFTEAKRQQSQSPYQHLLKPKRTGLQSMLKVLEHSVDGVLDLSLYYPGSSSFWQCMGGVHKHIECAMSLLPCPEQSDLDDWLADRWRKKEEFLQQCH